MPDKKFKELRKAQKEGKSSAFWGNNEPKCPHCGEQYSIDKNEAYRLYDDNNRHNVTCPKCDGDFSVRTSCVYSFHTDEQEDE